MEENNKREQISPTQHAIHRAWDHITTRTLAGVTLTAFRTALHDPRVQAAEGVVNAMALKGDVLATQEATQAWNKAWRQALKALRAEAA